MRHVLQIVLAMAILGAGVRAEENASVEAYYPEGPLRWGDTLYFAEMHKDRVVSLTNEVPDTFYQHDGCGPTAIATYADGFVVLCHLPNELHQISASGAFADKFDRDESGAAFRNPNDASSDDAGGVYFTASGVFSLNAPREGALLYLAKDGKITRLASNLHYANGVYFDAAQQAVFLSEHFAQRVLRFPVVAPGELGPPEVFANLPVASLGKTVPYERAGPDGLETDADGNLYVAYYGAGLVLALSPEGEMTGRVDINEMLTTNVTLSADENSLFVTGSRISSRKPFPGMVRTMNNPLAKRDIER